jgi:2-iminobutanoate/2-iminopropanoate deaminase
MGRGWDHGEVKFEINPSSIAPPAAKYAHAVLTHGAQRWLHTSGVVPVQADGTVPDALEDQARVVWNNLQAMIAEAGMAVTDIVSITTYVVVGEDLGVIMAARDAVMGEHRAASTLVTVPALAQSSWRLEIALIAAR